LKPPHELQSSELPHELPFLLTEHAWLSVLVEERHTWLRQA